MPSPREHITSKARQWIALADDDLRVAAHTMRMSEPVPYRLVAYHAQQCAEKYLKAFLVVRQRDFPFTHNISMLLELCEPIAPWARDLTEAELLTVYAVTARYPGMEEPVTQAEARQAIQLASQVSAAVREALAHTGLGL